jgi:hypothetical protein
MRAKAVKVKEYDIAGAFDSASGNYIIRIFFGKGLIDCFTGRTPAEATREFETAGYRVIKEQSDQKQETESEDGRRGPGAPSSTASRV